MCGIVGVVSLGDPLPTDEAEIVVRMRDTMTHRGPDDSGIWRSPDGRAVLGHRRLSIIDVSSAGAQPLSNEDGTVWITYNGEVYNHLDLRQQLEAKGHGFRSHTDTEAIVHLYEERGVDLLDDLDGMFALGIWETESARLLLARDRLGVKPLYYTQVGTRLLFASEIKALLAHPAVPKDLDESALYHYLTFLTTPAPSTLFRGIHKLPAGHRVVVERGRVSIDRWWDAIVPTVRGRSEQEYVETIQSLLRDSIERRMMSDVPFGVFLSGGVDSSTNVALMTELMDRPVDTFTVGFKQNQEFNELEHAHRIAADFKTNHHEVLIDEHDLLDFLPEMVHYQDEPLADPVCVPVHYVAKLAKESGTTVIQVGEGADEIFCGYGTYMGYLRTHEREWRMLEAVPPMLRKIMGKSMIPLLRWRHRVQYAEFVRRSIRGEELFHGGAAGFYEVDKRKMVRGALRDAARSSGSVVDEYYREIDACKDADFLERLTYIDLKLRLPELLLMRVDKMTMANSVEARVPFLDHRLVEFAMSFTQEEKVPGGQAKYLLKRAVEGIIPDEIIYRKKMGFGAPITAWFRAGRLGDVFESVYARSGVRNLDLFDDEAVEAMLAKHRAGQEDYSFRLWTLTNFLFWYDHWFGNTRV